MVIHLVEARYLIASTCVITAALLFYSIGVWIEHVKGRLKFWHVGLILAGLVCDAVGTGLMKSVAHFTGMNNEMHTVVGVITIFIMMAHAMWAIWVLTVKTPTARLYYNRLSIFLWCIWLIPYFFEVYLGLSLHSS